MVMLTHNFPHAIQTKQQFYGHILKSLADRAFVEAIGCVVENTDTGFREFVRKQVVSMKLP